MAHVNIYCNIYITYEKRKIEVTKSSTQKFKKARVKAVTAYALS